MRLSRLTILSASVLLALVAPASALAKQSLAITSPTGFPAGSDPTYTTAINLDTSAGTPSSITIKLAPGVLAAPSANPSCLKTTQHTSSCEIGTGTVSALGLLPVPVTAYLAPPPSKGDVVGIDVVPISSAIPGLPVTHAGGKLVQTASGNVRTELNLSLSSLGPLASLVSGMSLTINGTLDGKPFNRMPTNCSPGHSSVTVVYSTKTETTPASPDFAPTGCAKLPYSPKWTATAHAVLKGAGKVVQTITQPAGQAATAKETLMLPVNSVAPNLGSVARQNTSTPVGSVVAVSPLLPLALSGHIFLEGTLTKPLLVFKFPPPAALTLKGAVHLNNDSVTISGVPDVPLTRLQVISPGGPHGLLAVLCPASPALLKGRFVAQSGKTATSTHAVRLTGC